LSDIDIAVYTSNKKKSDFLEIKFTLYADFCRALNRNDIDVVLLNTAKNTLLLENIVKEGIILFETPGGETIRKDFELKVRHQAIDFKSHRRIVMGI
jgi:predicted nucleotidyltransferase